jgi:FkbM family methyltransferase
VPAITPEVTCATLEVLCPEAADLGWHLLLDLGGPRLNIKLGDLPQEGPATVHWSEPKLDFIRGHAHLWGWQQSAGREIEIALCMTAGPAPQSLVPLARAHLGIGRADHLKNNSFVGPNSGWRLDTVLDETVVAAVSANQAQLDVRVQTIPLPGYEPEVLSIRHSRLNFSAISPDLRALKTLRQQLQKRAIRAPTAKLGWLLASRAFQKRWCAKGDSPGWVVREVLAQEMASRLRSGDEIALRLDTGDLVLCQPIDDSVLARRFLFEAGDEQGFISWIAGCVRQSDIAIDLGAAYGVVSRAMARQGAQVFAVEADPESASRILRSETRFAGGGSVTLIETAISNDTQSVIFAGMGASCVGSGKILADDKPETVAAFLTEISASGQLPMTKAIPHERERRAFGLQDVNIRKCRCTTVDLICAERGLHDVAIMKIDIEGGELLALRGATKLLDGDLGTPPVIAFEYSALFPTRGGKREEILGMFFQRKWRIFRLVGGKNLGGDMVEVLSAHEAPYHDNLIAIPP